MPHHSTTRPFLPRLPMRHILLSTFMLALGIAPLTAWAAPAAQAEVSAKARILGALNLPLKAQALRKGGTDEQEIKAGLKAARDSKLPATDAADLIEEAVTASREHGPVGNFGSFVKTQLDAGVRGKALAEAIRNEHASKGKGKGKADHGGNEGKGAGHDKDRPVDAAAPDAATPGEAGKPDDRGKPDDAGKPAQPGQPDDKGEAGKPGKSGDAGKPDDKAKPADAGKPGESGKPGDRGKPDDKTRPAKPD